MENAPAFALDPRLAAGSDAVAALPLCHVRLKRDARFLWLLLVPERPGLADLRDLAPDDRTRLWREILRADAAVAALEEGGRRPDKVNVALIGNVVRQMHVHVVGRFLNDPAWPGAVWHHGVGPERDPAAQGRLIEGLRGRF
ncbi:MAG: HIT domain-containing protein [Geminicoccaceae bacterium]|nr:HIT domain-containing protein [Geminicoccaceae bacterium]